MYNAESVYTGWSPAVKHVDWCITIRIWLKNKDFVSFSISKVYLVAILVAILDFSKRSMIPKPGIRQILILHVFLYLNQQKPAVGVLLQGYPWWLLDSMSQYLTWWNMVPVEWDTTSTTTSKRISYGKIKTQNNPLYPIEFRQFKNLNFIVICWPPYSAWSEILMRPLSWQGFFVYTSEMPFHRPDLFTAHFYSYAIGWHTNSCKYQTQGPLAFYWN